MIRTEIADEYAQRHSKPWIVAYSGGKDSTLVAHLVIEHLMSLPRSERSRSVHVVANDTLVESPLVVDHFHRTLDEIEQAVSAFELPLIVAITKPELDQTFWVNLIGRGYPSPNRMFRWCTDRMKIQPTSKYVRDNAKKVGEVILLLGVRRNESSLRAGMVSRYDNGERLNPHNDLQNCHVFRPIVDLETDDVWEFLGERSPPWGGTHDRLIELYRNASGGDCPIITSKQDVPSCGTTSARFGCWTCTVVDKDKSLEGFVDAGFEQFLPLLSFRDWLLEIRNDPERRLARRRDGRFTITSTGVHIPGPFTISTRKEILNKLLDLQHRTELLLISEEEINRIRDLWINDALTDVSRSSSERLTTV